MGVNLMSVYQSEENCTGCGACSSICPKNCISMKLDSEGFWYPAIDDSKCIGCGACKRVCHYNSVLSLGCNESFYAGTLKEKGVLFEVSSGGASWALMKSVIGSGGVVYGARQEAVGSIHHDRAETIEQAKSFRRSKYLPSFTADIFKMVKKDLIDGRTVLFTGTGCQVAACKAFLGKDYPNLITCDVVCHGVPSLTAFQKYKDEIERKQSSSLISLNCRNKSQGWKNSCYELIFENGASIVERSEENLFHKGYLEGFFYRPSCGTCKYSRLPKPSDITLADFWQYKGRLLKSNESTGISLIVCSSEKGRRILDSALDYLEIDLSSRRCALSSCRHLRQPPSVNTMRKSFFENLKGHSYAQALSACININNAEMFLLPLKVKFLNKICTFYNHAVRKSINNLDEREKLIYQYSLEQGINTCFPKTLMQLACAILKRTDKQIITDKRIYRLISKLARVKYISVSHAFSTIKNIYPMREAIRHLSINSVPVYFFNRVGDAADNIDFSRSARSRLDNGIDFIKMLENPRKYESDFKELIGDKYSPEYVEQLGKIPQVVKKGSSYRHEDYKSSLVNVVAGFRITLPDVDTYQKVIHVYGRCGAFGYAVEDSENFPSQLQKYLVKHGYSIKVMNHGLWGADDECILTNFLQDAQYYKKNDIVLFYQAKYDDAVMQSLQNDGLKYFDIDKEFYSYSESKWCCYDRPGHINRDGYRIVGKIIFEKLIEDGFSVGSVTSLYQGKCHWENFIENHKDKKFTEEVNNYISSITKGYPISDDKRSGAIVMNCNPFTFGHRYLAEYAASQVDRLYIFVVEEDKSLFKFSDRFEMVKNGLRDLKNVVVVPSGKFMISAVTFPEYFMKDYIKEKNFDVSGDLELFCKEIAPGLNISERFAGEEPLDPVTAHYNESMRRILPMYGLRFFEISRLKYGGG